MTFYLRKIECFVIVKANISSIDNGIEWSMATEPFLQKPGSRLDKESIN
jgi:hypothetical protein